MILETNISSISHAIQLAVAPVFLLTGIAALLGVMTARLARILDRARRYEQDWKTLDEEEREAGRAVLIDLGRRRRFAAWAINQCAFAALLVCVVVAVLFVDAFFDINLSRLSGGLFIVAMFTLIGGLSCFLREVYIATHTIRIFTETDRT